MSPPRPGGVPAVRCFVQLPTAVFGQLAVDGLLPLGMKPCAKPPPTPFTPSKAMSQSTKPNDPGQVD